MTSLLPEPQSGSDGDDVAKPTLVTGWLVALPPTVLMFAVGMIGIGSRDMWHDEYATWTSSTLPWRQLVTLIHSYDFVIAPYYVVMHVWISVFGDGLTTLRMPSLLAMSVSAGLVALIGRRLFDPAVGLVAGLLFAVVPSTSRFGREARPYGFAMLGTLLATVALLRVLESPNTRKWVWYSIALVGAGMAHIVAITVLFAHAVLVVHDVRDGKDAQLRHWVRAAAASVAALTPVVLIGSQQTRVIAWIQRDAAAVRQLPGEVFGSGAVAAVVIGLGLLVAARLLRSDRRAVQLLLTWAIVPAVFCYLTFPLVHLFLSRYLLFTMPAWVLLAAASGFAMARSVGDAKPPLRLSAAGLLVVAAVAVIGLPGQATVRDERPTSPEFRVAFAEFSPLIRSGDGVVFAGHAKDGGNGKEAFAYARSRGSVAPLEDVLDATPERAVERLGQIDRLWLISTTSAREDELDNLVPEHAAALRADFSFTPAVSARGVRIFRLDRLP